MTIFLFTSFFLFWNLLSWMINGHFFLAFFFYIYFRENSGKSAVDLAQGNNQLIHLLENPPISHGERKLSQDALGE